MLINKWFFKRLKAWEQGTLTVIVILCFCITSGAAAEAGNDMTVVTGRVSENEWRVTVDPSPWEYTQGRKAALLLRIEVEGACRITEILPGDGAEGMTLTVSAEDGRGINLLLDGAFSDQGDILRIRTEGEGGVRVSPGERGGPFLYCMTEEGSIMTCPLVFENLGALQEGEEESAQEEGEVETAGKDIPHRIQFVGCRETTPQNGCYAVQFFFDGEEEFYPVYCLLGQGSMTLETGELLFGEEKWRVCTFRGLRREAAYEFLVATGKGWVKVRYADGEFKGFYAEFS